MRTLQKHTGIKECLLHILHSPWLPFAALWVFLQIAFASLVLFGGDEEMYGAVLQTSTLWDFLVKHYYTWSPRTLLEIVEIYISMWPWWIWRILTPLVITIGAVSAAFIMNTQKSAKTNWILCALFLLYRWENLNTAGWISTTLVYLWPAVACMVALVPVMQLVRGQKPHLWLCIVCLPLLLYGANMEHCMIAYLLILLVVFGYHIVTRRLPHWLVWAQGAVVLADMLYTATCPGEHARYINEVVSWCKNFGMRSVFIKFETGLYTSLQALVFSKNFVFTMFCLLLCITIWYRYKNAFFRLLAVYPLVVTLLFGFCAKYTAALFPSVFTVIDDAFLLDSIHLGNCNMPLAYIPLLLLCSVLCAVIVNLYIALGHTRVMVFGLTVFLAGFASFGAMGFTPTIAVSGLRTGFLCEVCILGLAALLYHQNKDKRGVIMWAFYAFFGVNTVLQMASLIEM